MGLDVEETCEKVRRNVARRERHGLTVVVASDPSRVMARGDGHICVPELLAHVAELDARREELAREGVG